MAIEGYAELPGGILFFITEKKPSGISDREFRVRLWHSNKSVERDGKITPLETLELSAGWRPEHESESQLLELVWVPTLGHWIGFVDTSYPESSLDKEHVVFGPFLVEGVANPTDMELKQLELAALLTRQIALESTVVPSS